MDALTIVLLVLLVAAIVAFAVKSDGGGFSLNLGSIQSILVLLILVLFAVWLGEKVLG